MFAALLLALVSVPSPSEAGEPFLSTLRLDPFSIVSFGDQEVYQLPEGSEIVFEFSAAEGTGSLGFQIRPRNALIAPIGLRREDESLRFTLARSAGGVMRLASDGRPILEIDAYVVVTLDHPESPGSKRLPIHFTTESARARSLAGDRVIDVSGGRISGRGVQLVGVATNAEDDYPRPGAPVYVILSGAFDRLPVLH
jgi:hypothetical protein